MKLQHVQINLETTRYVQDIYLLKLPYQNLLGGILDIWSENVWLAAKGGGIGSYWGNLRSIGEKIGTVGKTSGKDSL